MENTIYSTIDGAIRVTITGDLSAVEMNLRPNEAYVPGVWPGHLYKVDLATGQVVEIPQA